MFNSSGLSNYLHADWLGTSRLSLDVSGNLYVARSYAPFGETYNGATGSAGLGGNDRSFTGQTQDVIAGPTGIYDFLFRQQASSQGRWLVPDPAGLAAVDITNPQTWNRYAYVLNNPLSFIDPLGLDCGSGTQSNFPSHQDGNFVANVSGSCPPSFWGTWGNIWGAIAGIFRFQYQIEPPDREAFRQTKPQPDPQPQPEPTKNCPKSSGILQFLPHGGGTALSGQIDAGAAAAGGVATGSSGTPMFVSNSGTLSAGSYFSGGAAAYAGSHTASAPSSSKIGPFALGAYGGLGFGLFVSNAQSPLQLKGPFAQWSANIGVGPGYSVNFAYDNASGIYTLGISEGPGFGLSGTALTTTTAVKATGNSCD